MKIVTVVGARPQFIKAAAGSRALRREHREILVHTGQHYDANMSDIFFQEMGIPRPDYNLGIAGGTHGEMTGRMLIEIEKVLLAEKPDALLVYGDTNSTLAAALAAVKLMIPVLHVEAGNRLGTNDNPEEINRICTDHCSRMLFAATESCMENLRKENLAAKAHLVGNIMYDSFLHFANQPWEHPNILDFDGKAVTVPKEYYFMTCHRQENTGSDEALEEIFSAMNVLLLKGYTFYLPFFLLLPISFFRYNSRAAVIDGASGVGASTSRRKPASFTALAVVGPKHPIFISSCLKFGKFFNREEIPEGLKNTSIS